jgi:acetyl esterase
VPLDPEVEALLLEMAQAEGKPLEESTPAEARAASWDWLRWVGEPEDVAQVGHRFIPGPTADLPVRIYTPNGVAPFPALVYFHGSGWTISNIELADAPHRALANRTGCVVIAVNYQKAPEHKYPTPFDDAYATLEWVHNHAAGLSVDPSRIGVGGDSAGGNLAAAICLKARDRRGPDIAFQLLVYPATDCRFDLPSMVENSEGYLLTTAGVRWFWGQYLADPADADDPYACPMRAVDFIGLPPAVIITAEYDPLRDDGEAYASRLSEAGVPVVLRRYEGMVHGFLWASGVLAGSRRLLDDLGADVRRLLSDLSSPPDPDLTAPKSVHPTATTRG